VTSKPVITGGQAANVAQAAAQAATQRSFFRPAPIKTEKVELKPTPPKDASPKMEARLMPPPKSTPGSARGTPLKPMTRTLIPSPRIVSSPKPVGHFAAGTAAADGLTHLTNVEVDANHVAGTTQSL
jgi:hypothetical protein